MRFLDFIFGKNKKNKKDLRCDKGSEMEVLFLDNLVRVPSIDFVGFFKKSTSGEWVVGWSDSDKKGHIGGYRDRGHGRYFIYNAIEKTLVFQGWLERPNNAHIANNGSVSIEDWKFGSNLSGTFYILSCSGDELIKKDLAANIVSSSISDNGQLAICQTANSKCGDDGNLLIGFNIESGREVFSINPPTGWADEYDFDEENIRFGSVFEGIGTFFYSSDGSFLDRSRFDLSRLQSSRYEVYLIASEEVVTSEESSLELVREALKASEKALTLEGDEYSHWKALALKVKGLAYERLGEYNEALSSLEAALEINPKIGVKRKANAIRKKLEALG